jgi:hypothetical protein
MSRGTARTADVFRSARSVPGTGDVGAGGEPLYITGVYQADEGRWRWGRGPFGHAHPGASEGEFSCVDGAKRAGGSDNRGGIWIQTGVGRQGLQLAFDHGHLGLDLG